MFRDGPLRYRAPEEIRYGTGKCALGAILVALSGKGIVTIMIRDKVAELVRDLQSRFPKAELVRDEKGCRATVATAIKYVAAPIGPFGLRLDLRGTPFQLQVLREVLKIPFGQTSDYSAIAEAIGAPKAVRAVGSTCTHNWWAFAVPCHRVLHKGGGRRDTPQYRFADYEAKLAAKRKAK
ncbi:MAG: methylated-DNA--[protein]-cysteine S-methyltransferase [Proteobacteria bacterium]|nr:methylated-DNA--[protein]-cysteine S-methyltransferase [Pseudomonadota bacterium]